MESTDLLGIGVSLDGLGAFDDSNVRESGSAHIEYHDPSVCVRPIDVGCANPRLPVGLTNPVTGSLFRVEMTISGYEVGAVVSGGGALCYEPKPNTGSEG